MDSVRADQEEGRDPVQLVGLRTVNAAIQVRVLACQPNTKGSKMKKCAKLLKIWQNKTARFHQDVGVEQFVFQNDNGWWSSTKTKGKFMSSWKEIVWYEFFEEVTDENGKQDIAKFLGVSLEDMEQYSR